MATTMAEDDDAFWAVQLSGNVDVDVTAANKRQFASGVPRSDHQVEDGRALPAGTNKTDDAGLARLLGGVQVVSIPIMMSGEFDAVRSVDQIQLLLVRLRQVNGDGVMSRVGGDVWCAALLLSAWLLANPEVVRGQSVLELGSGLGLCGIVAGYLSKSVTLTDYVDELLENLHYNVEVNHSPRVINVADECLGCPLPTKRTASLEGGGIHEQCPLPRDMRNQDNGGETSARVSNPASLRHGLEGGALRPPNLDSSETHGNLSSASVGTVVGSAGDPPGRIALRPLSRLDVVKVDWTAYAGQKPVGDFLQEDGEERTKFWWDDEGPGAPGSGTPTASRTVGPEPLCCNVAIGSALIYSPHHACVADVLRHAFAEGGCRVAYIIQLTTRPGFDEFLLRLGSLGLCYRLQKISSVLPDPLLSNLRRRTSSWAVIGGPVTRHDDAPHDLPRPSIGSKGQKFDEFVLCRVFRSPETQA